MKRTTREDYERRVLRVQKHIEANLGENVAPADLARVAGMSRHHFHRVFRAVTGESILGFRRRLRLERAARQLIGSPGQVLSIALEAGYGSHEAFTRAFAEVFGVPPSEYRAEREALRCAREARVPDGVEVREMTERRFVFRRHVGSYLGVPALWERVWGWYVGRGGVPGPDVETFGLVPDDPSVTLEENLRYDACIVTELEPAEGEPVSEGRLPGGRYAVLTHRGPYDGLSESYLALIGAWFPTSGYVLAAEPVVERYLNTPNDTAPEDLVTEVWARIEERGWLT